MNILRNTLSELNGRYKDRSRNLEDVKHVSFPCANIIVTDFYVSKKLKSHGVVSDTLIFDFMPQIKHQNTSIFTTQSVMFTV